MANGSSPAQGRIGAVITMSATYTAAHSHTGSLTHRVRPGIQPASSRTLCQGPNLLSLSGNSLNGLSLIIGKVELLSASLLLFQIFSSMNYLLIVFLGM